VLRDQGKYEQAEEMYRQEVRLCKTVLGRTLHHGHPVPNFASLPRDSPIREQQTIAWAAADVLCSKLLCEWHEGHAASSYWPRCGEFGPQDDTRAT